MKWQVALIIRPLALIERHWHRRLGLRLCGRRAKTADPKPKLEPETPNPEPKTLKRRAAPHFIARRPFYRPNCRFTKVNGRFIKPRQPVDHFIARRPFYCHILSPVDQ